MAELPKDPTVLARIVEQRHISDDELQLVLDLVAMSGDTPIAFPKIIAKLGEQTEEAQLDGTGRHAALKLLFTFRREQRDQLRLWVTGSESSVTEVDIIGGRPTDTEKKKGAPLSCDYSNEEAVYELGAEVAKACLEWEKEHGQEIREKISSLIDRHMEMRRKCDSFKKSFIEDIKKAIIGERPLTWKNINVTKIYRDAWVQNPSSDAEIEFMKKNNPSEWIGEYDSSHGCFPVKGGEKLTPVIDHLSELRCAANGRCESLMKNLKNRIENPHLNFKGIWDAIYDYAKSLNSADLSLISYLLRVPPTVREITDAIRMPYLFTDMYDRFGEYAHEIEKSISARNAKRTFYYIDKVIRMPKAPRSLLKKLAPFATPEIHRLRAYFEM